MGKGASAKQEVVEYRMSIHAGIAHGGGRLRRIFVGEKVAWSGDEAGPAAIHIHQPELFGGVKKEGGVSGTAWFLPGREDQVLPDALAARFGLTGATCPAFRGKATLFFVGSDQASGIFGDMSGLAGLAGGAVGGALTGHRGGFYWTANSPFIQPMWLEYERVPVGLDPATATIGADGDVNPAHIIYECMTNTDWGMGEASWRFNLSTWEAAAATLKNEGFGLSIRWTQQSAIQDFVNEIIDHIQALLFVNPTNGLWEIKLLRDDYDPGALVEINPSNATLEKFQRRMWGEAASEVVVSYTNRENGQSETVAAQDLGTIVAQGGISSTSRPYPAIRDPNLAVEVAARDVRSTTAPLAFAEVAQDRRAWSAKPGDVRRLNWPEHGPVPVTVRVMKVDYGKPGDPEIKLSVMEDIFSMARPPTIAPPSSGWTGSEEPAAMANARVFTLPAFLAMPLLDFGDDDLLSYPEVLAGILAFQSGGDTFAYELAVERPQANGVLAWTGVGVRSLLGRAEIVSAIFPEAVTTMTGLPNIEMNRGPQIGGFAIFGDGVDAAMEFAIVRAFADGTWTLDRGALDTVPRHWPADTPVWFLPVKAAIDDDEVRSAGEVVEYKLLTRTSLGLLNIDDAPIVSGTLSPRPYLPLRPADVKINGTGFGEVEGAQRTNHLRNSILAGGATGSPGTPPTNTAFSTGSGLTREIVAFGTDAEGWEYMEIRWFGTPASSGVANAVFGFEASTGVSSAAGETWTGSFDVQLVAGALPGDVVTQIQELNGAGTSVSITSATCAPPVDGTTRRYDQTRTLAGGTTAHSRPRVAVTTSAGVPVDFTLRVRRPMYEKQDGAPHLSYPTEYIRTEGAAVTVPTMLACTWANRNRLFEEGQALKWTDGSVAPEYLQEILITVYREDGTEFFQVRGLWEETSYDIPYAWLEEETRIFVRFSCEREGLSSLQNHGLWVDDLPLVGAPAAPPASPVVVGPAPDPPDPDPGPEPDPLPPPDDPPPPGGGGGGEWENVGES